MKHRIRELAEQAGFDIEDGHIMLHHVYLTNRMEKFAELIVRECVEVVNDFGEDVENGDIFRDKNQNLLKDIQSNHLGPLVWAAPEHIKKHFGVEE